MGIGRERYLGRKKEYIKNWGWLLTICFIAMTFIPRSFDNVLFMDGLAYAAIARNMAIGQGTIWEPHFADSFWLPYNYCSFFCEHPPLMFFLESLLFRMLGDTTAVENIYDTIILLVSIWLIVCVWRKLFEQNSQIREQAWWPILLWYGLRMVWWSMPNNLLDTTMAVFCLGACYFQLLAITSGKFRVFYWVASGVLIVFACLTKGPVGIYPLAFPAIYSFIYGRSFYKIALKGTVTAFAVLLSLMFLLMQYSPASYFLTNYFQGQVMAALLKKREKVADDWTAHFHLLKLLLFNIIPHLVMLTALFAANFYLRGKPYISSQSKKVCFLTFLLTASVILPMLISVKQGDHYLLPALPFVGLFFAACSIELLLPVVLNFYAGTRILFVILSAISLSMMTYKLVYPEPDSMFDLSRRLSAYVPTDSKVYLPNKISNCPEIQTSFQRYSRLSVAYDPKSTRYLFFDDIHDNVLDSVKRTGVYQIVDLGLNATLAIHK
ncbi:hypothetical protein DYBT9275_05890 [Dyadobacter sp. CECT 9275]|uniref:Glycosyltransferase RgtA/B/C/D-like domain-containing protein n=1 Tax=Dyadobacter helix TaxID=2822344 RepID=A0A916JHW2_9BACT|nr:glycosyltransferase family 39 protein [Dyadobacter sp. CECT 9275]CAG5017999.1 hypothetical protein DYBT9275_05890 [Dyadobacter sp. CECT 9275]